MIFFFFAVIAAAFWGAALGAFAWQLDEARTRITALDEYRPSIGSKLYSADGEVLGVPLNEIPLHLQKAFIASEDHTFYEHKGVRPLAIVSAALDVLQTGRLRGGSTITQQLVRNVEPTRIGQERTLRRKLDEAFVAFQVEREFTKDEILELYLNQIFLGKSARGVEAAAQQYFAKSCRDLTLGECAMIAGLTPAPNTIQPFRSMERAKAHRDWVLRRMLENNFITKEECDAAAAEPLEEQVVMPEERQKLVAAGRVAFERNRFKAPYYVDAVRRLLLDEGLPSERGVEVYDWDQIAHQGLKIYTTVDMRLQRVAEEVLEEKLEELDDRKRKELERQDRGDEFVPVTGALVCIDNRPGREGYVRALVGGRNYDEEKFNTAIQALRQPGSSVKPFVWTAAIDNGYSPSSIEVDEPIVRVDAARNVWRPKNFSGTFSGPITLRRALEKSVNIISIKLVERLGMPLVRGYIEKAGFRTPIGDEYRRTIALGAHSATVLDQCVAYSTFAHLGDRYDAVFVTEIRDHEGFTRYHSGPRKTPQAIPRDVAYVMTYLLEGVARYGTGARSRDLNRPFCGFTPDFTCVVWIGYADNRPLGRGRDYTGGVEACPVWTKFMVKAHEGLPVREFEVPEGVKFIKVNRDSGVRGGSWPEAFIRGAQPPEPRSEDELTLAQQTDAREEELLRADSEGLD